MRVIRNALLCCCLGATAAFPWFQSAKQPARPPYIELTQVDLFSVKDWTSAQVEVGGVRLGMSRDEANHAAAQHALRLVQHEGPTVKDAMTDMPCSHARYCELFGLSPHSYQFVNLTFTDKLIEIEFDLPQDSGGSLIRNLKGQIRQLFQHKYSDGLRLRLLGPESSREVIDARDTKYTYAKRGFTMTIARQGVTEPGYELDRIGFIPPAPQQ